MKYTKISATGSYLPEKIVTNFDLEKTLDTSNEWIISRTGIVQRHMAGEKETSSSMAELASREALTKANCEPDDLDMIIVATCTPDRVFPNTACFLQKRLGIQKTIPAFDVSVACAGYIYALSIADQYIRNGAAENILIVGSEVMTRTVDWKDRRIAILFGDGAGATLLSASDAPGVHSTHLHAQGQENEILSLPNDMCAPGLSSGSPYMCMEGPDVFKFAVKALGDAVTETMNANKDVIKQLDWLVPHQANLRIINAIAKRLKLPMEKVILTIAEHANTSSASIPLALHDGIVSGKIKSGDNVLMESFGGGLTWGSALVTI